MRAPEIDWQPTASFDVLRKRAAILRRIRAWFDEHGALEVETAALSSAAVSDVHLASVRARVGGALRYLHTSPEFAMKRLLAAGSGDLWQIARVYRDGESGRLHNPEFTMLEWYRLGIDHHPLMREVDALLRAACAGLRDPGRTEYLSYRDAFERHAGVDPFAVDCPGLCHALRRARIDVPASIDDDRDTLLDLAVAALIGPQLGRDGPAFIYDYPASQAALARRRGAVASRFELYLDGIELANGFHELSDVREQRQRFAQDLRIRRARGLPAHPVDHRFLAALEHGLPECAGVALGFDRLVMCAVGAQHIDHVIAFPVARA